jgi:hypothetical protein
MALARDDATIRASPQDDVDDASRSGHGHLGICHPRRPEPTNELLDHGCLEPVSQARAGGWEVADSSLGSEAAPDGNERIEARAGHARFDSQEMRRIDIRAPGQRRTRDAGIGT